MITSGLGKDVAAQGERLGRPNGAQGRYYLGAGSVPPRPGNLILAALSDADYEQLAPLLELHSLRKRETLVEAGDPADYVYFPLNGVISALNVFEDGMMIEFATIGSEGTTGVPLFLGFGASNTALISQVPGDALRLKRADFLGAIARLDSFAAVLLRYSGLMLALISQSAACNRAHHADARCARWLLTTHDQAGRDNFPITQEYLALMLGVSRPSVALSAAALQRAKVLSYHRGEMQIIDRRGLELAACECYGVVREHLVQFVTRSHRDEKAPCAPAGNVELEPVPDTGVGRKLRSGRRQILAELGKLVDQAAASASVAGRVAPLASSGAAPSTR